MYQLSNHSLPVLFCKPSQEERLQKALFSKFYPGISCTISFRSLELKTDLSLIHDWVNQDYALEYWQMNGHFSQLYAIYQCMEYNPFAHSFIGMLNGNIVCQFDVYSVAVDELKEHIQYEKHDCGFHLLMSPNKNPVRGLSSAMIKAFLDFYFSFPQAKRMYAEPDVNNFKSIALLEKAGFEKIKSVEMSYKQAHIYSLQKSNHESTF